MASTLTGRPFELAAGGYRARITEVGGSLAGLWHDGVAVTAEHGPGLPVMSSGAVLMPWPNRIRDGRYTFEGRGRQLPLSEPAKHNASHGLVRWERWSVAEQTAASVTLELDVVPQTGYDFELSVRLRYALDATTGLTVTPTARNTGQGPLPFGVGFHPYLDLAGLDYDHVEVALPADTVLHTDDRSIPISSADVGGTPYDLRELRPLGSLRVDHCYTDLTGTQAVVRIAGAERVLWWDDAYRYVQLFTAPVERFGSTALAMEPMTCPADAFNSGSGLTVLQPGQEWSASWGVRVGAAG